MTRPAISEQQSRSPLQIIVVHNAYSQRGGEDSVVQSEVELLRKNGHVVRTLTRDNRNLEQTSKARAAGEAIWSSRAQAELRSLIKHTRPDIIHSHNTFPIISPSIYWTAHAERVPVIQTLHNFRLLCPQAMFLREGRVCEDCLGRTPVRAVAHACYRGSRVQSAVLASMLVVHRSLGTWDEKVTRYIALNDFCRRKFIEGGLPEQKIRLKPNFIDAPAFDPESERSGVLFVGRMSEEKGIDVLIRAAAAFPASTIRAVGCGPLDAEVRRQPGLDWVGSLGAAEVQQQMRAAGVLVVPSIWYENFPRTIVEAFAAGLPVIASRLGALPEIVTDGETGLLFNPGDPEDLVRKIQWSRENPGEMRRMGLSARRAYEQHFSADVNYTQLMAIYDEAIRDQQS